MKTAARVGSTLLLVYAAGVAIALIGAHETHGLSGFVGTVAVCALLVAIFALPTVPALLALGQNTSAAVRRFALFANKSYLFLLVAATLGFGLQRMMQSSDPSYEAALIAAWPLCAPLFLNVAALERQGSRERKRGPVHSHAIAQAQGD
jgi:hypothetical protein